MPGRVTKPRATATATKPAARAVSARAAAKKADVKPQRRKAGYIPIERSTRDHDEPVAAGRATTKARAAAEAHPEQPAAKRQKKTPAEPAKPAKAPAAVPKTKKPAARMPTPAPVKEEGPLNQAPTDVLAVFVFGDGDCGTLGLGPKQKEAPRARLNPFLDPDSATSFKVVQLDCGGLHVVALTNDNQIVTWGVNDRCALGRDTTWDGEKLRDMDENASSDDDEDDLNPLESTPTAIPADSFPPGTRFAQVAAADNLSLALTEDGQVYGWGTFVSHNGKDLFGYDSNSQPIKISPTPVLIPGLSNITQIACGANHCLALDSSGSIWAWGITELNRPGRRVTSRHAVETFMPHRLESPKNVKYIATGSRHSFAVDKRDNVWGWGRNSYGEAGYAKGAGSETAIYVDRPKKVPDLCGKGVFLLTGGGHHSAAITEENECLVWGRMDGGQLGIQFTAEQLADDSLIKRGELRNDPRICLRPTPVPGIGEAVYVACGIDHTIFVNEEGKAYGSGFGSQGQLGIASEDDVDVATLITGKAIKGRVLSWTGAGGNFTLVAGLAGARVDVNGNGNAVTNGESSG
ncbi:putative Ran exchange factor Prp20/Pim1 [Apodospora peruviana]|uniref:Ran exchange factor Prp20/Pim1 n=1 Tax=Apodospora peruviana TaxID=516989 RepID=A0AAE0IQ27_9PEZI|nr:putative Ran exchange factor Prp20/Pim1 [Apodospora peruviana]